MRYARPRGFSLIEVLVALFLIGLMIILFQVTQQGIPLIKYTKDQDIALDIARGELESLRALGYDALPGSGPFSDSSLSEIPSGTGTLTVSDFNAKTKQVTVTVTWRELNATADSSLSLTTLITKTGGL